MEQINKKITRNYTFTNIEQRNGEACKEGEIYGKPILFNRKTDLGYFDEIIDADALNEADLKDVRLCLNHDTSYVYARSRNNNNNSTMQLDVVEDGLEFDAVLDLESARHKDYYTAVKRGDIDQMSFMFTIDEDAWENLETEHPTRHIRKIGKVFEISAVSFPAYEQTSINCRDAEEALESARATLESEKAKQREERVQMLKEKLNKVGASNV